jgi:hypothetical protein
MSCNKSWCEEKSMAAVEDLARAAEVIRDRGGDPELVPFLAGAISDSLKLMSVFLAATEERGWTPHDAELILKDGTEGFRKLVDRYRAGDDLGYYSCDPDLDQGVGGAFFGSLPPNGFLN